MFFDYIWRNLTKNKVLRLESAKYDINIFFFFLYFFFLDPGVPDRIQIFWPIRIRTEEKSLIRIRTKGPGSETLHFLVTRQKYDWNFLNILVGGLPLSLVSCRMTQNDEDVKRR